jgi:hypothetical protein
LEVLEAVYPLMMLIHVFLDNARYHHAKLVQEWLERPGCRIRLHFIPSYCPHLNPIERLWGVMHRNVTHNKCYATVAQFADATLGFLRGTIFVFLGADTEAFMGPGQYGLRRMAEGSFAAHPRVSIRRKSLARASCVPLYCASGGTIPRHRQRRIRYKRTGHLKRAKAATRRSRWVAACRKTHSIQLRQCRDRSCSSDASRR